MCATERIFPAEAWDEISSLAAAREALELLLAESLRLAHESGALRSKDLARVTVDTTVQPKNVAFPTEAIKGLNRLANKHGVRLRQSYVRIAKHAPSSPPSDTTSDASSYG
jgi:IS5 family transposase